jgi:1,5-anhydro-D-fructose reductase (1,5-anhydro-D-mannitol-forming)
LVAVAGRDQARTEAFAAKHGAAMAVSDYDALLANKDVDAVLVTTPNALHEEQAIAAARAGKHVLADKPLTLSAAGAERVLAECSRAGVKIGMNFQTRHQECFQVARRAIREGRIGDIVSVQIDASPGANPLRGWRTDPEIAGLGATNNIAVHIYDLLRFLVGSEVSEVVALFENGREAALERLPMALLRFENGALAFANGNQLTARPLNDIVIHGTIGRIDGRGLTRPLAGAEMRILTEEGETTGTYDSRDCYHRLLAAFSEAVLAGRDPDPSGLDGLRSVQLTDAITESVRQGRVVKVRY